jgi:hypothetical protein
MYYPLDKPVSAWVNTTGGRPAGLAPVHTFVTTPFNMTAATPLPSSPPAAKCMLIHWNKSLKAFNTFGIDARAKMLTAVESVEELQRVLRQSKLKDEDKLVIGGGSNMLFTQDFPGLVIHNDIKVIETV